MEMPSWEISYVFKGNLLKQPLFKIFKNVNKSYSFLSPYYRHFFCHKENKQFFHRESLRLRACHTVVSITWACLWQKPRHLYIISATRQNSTDSAYANSWSYDEAHLWQWYQDNKKVSFRYGKKVTDAKSACGCPLTRMHPAQIVRGIVKRSSCTTSPKTRTARHLCVLRLLQQGAIKCEREGNERKNGTQRGDSDKVTVLAASNALRVVSENGQY